MKSTVIAIAASVLLAGADARSFLRRNAHAEVHARLEKRGGYEAPEAQTCKVVTYTTWVPYTAPTYDTTQYVQSTVYVKPTPSTTSSYGALTTVPASYAHPVPTPDVTTCPTPGTYTFPAKTITLTSTEYVCVPTSTVVPPGTHTYGYTTTVVATETTVTCPYATTYTSSSAVYTTLTSTILYCPAAGTHTYGGYTTTVTKTATLSYPTVTTYVPGTYTHPVSTVTVTATDVVYTCPYSAYVTPASVPLASTYVAPAPKPTTYAPAPKPETYAAAPKPITYAPAPAAKPSTYASVKPHTSSTPSSGGDIGAGKQWCITYTQYNDDKSCKSAGQIDTDMADIAAKGFKSVRIYAPDCDALEAISSACAAHGLKIVMGVFLRKEDQAAGWADAYKQITTLTAWGKWSLVELIVIGNEAVFGGIISSSELSGLINSARGHFQSAGYTGPITTSEVVSTLQENPGLCSCIDVVAVNIQPFFNGGYAADAGTFLKSQMQLAHDVCGKKTYCLEAGWPSAGSPLGNAQPGTYEQKQALEAIYGIDEGYIAYYTTYNDGWKDSGMNGGVEQHFGCANLFPLGGSY